jgi:hypothetical protein
MIGGVRTASFAALAWLLAAASSTAQPLEPQRFQIEGRYQWHMHGFKDASLGHDDVSRAGVTLKFKGILTVTNVANDQLSVTWRAQRVQFKVGPRHQFGDHPQAANRQWTLQHFEDRQRLRKRLHQVVVHYRPIFRLPTAAAYETEALGVMLALMDEQTVRVDPQRRPFHNDKLQAQTDALLANWAPRWPSDVSVSGRWRTVWPFNIPGDTSTQTRPHYLPHHIRLRALLWNQIKSLTLFASEPTYRRLPTGATLFREDDAPPHTEVGTRRGAPELAPELRKGDVQSLPAFSLLALYGWVPISDEAMNIEARLPRSSADLASRALSRLKRLAATQRDRKRVSDAKRGKLTVPRPLTQERAIVAAQRLREAEARLEILDRADLIEARLKKIARKRNRADAHRHGAATGGPKKPWQLEDKVAELLVETHNPHLWVLAERSVNHDRRVNQIDGDKDVPFTKRRVTVRTEVPSSPAVRLYDSNAPAEADRSGFSPEALGHLRSRIRLQGEVFLQASRR